MSTTAEPVAVADTKPPSGRPRLNLKPRDPNAAAKLEQERQAALASKVCNPLSFQSRNIKTHPTINKSTHHFLLSNVQNPFGAAKSREEVIAQRLGTSVDDVLRAEQEKIKQDKLHLRLNSTQVEEKRSHEAAVKEIQDQIISEEDQAKKDLLQAELAARQQSLDDVMAKFEKVTLETALSGEAPRMSEMRRKQLLQQQAMDPEQLQQYQQQYNYQHRGGAGGGPPGGGGAARYNPTQQYRGGARGGGGGRHYNNNTNSQQYRGGRGGRGRGSGSGSGHLPEWAVDDPSSSIASSASHGGGSFDAQGSFKGGGYRTGAYDDSDAGFFDGISGSNGGGGRGGYRGGGGHSGGRGGGRGGGMHHHHHHNHQGDIPLPPLGGGGSAGGIGGEINIDTSFGQDRY